jgi:hypothetical protein
VFINFGRQVALAPLYTERKLLRFERKAEWIIWLELLLVLSMANLEGP